MTISLFMVNSIRYKPQHFRVGLPRVPSSSMIAIPREHKEKNTQFRMCVGNIQNPDSKDTNKKTSTNFFKGHWSLTGWISSFFKEPFIEFNRAPVSDFISFISLVIFVAPLLYGTFYALELVKDRLKGSLITILVTTIIVYKVFTRGMSKLVKVGDWIMVHKDGRDVFGRIEDIGLFSSIMLRELDGRSIYLPTDFIYNNIITIKSVKSHVHTSFRLNISGGIDAIEPILAELTEMMQKLSTSNEENCHNIVSIESFDLETSSIEVFLCCYLKVDEPKDYLALKGKLLMDIFELLGPQVEIKVLSDS